ncbi:MAG: conjugative transfer signal peptidase TraF [Micropepsaceae bacterium]
MHDWRSNFESVGAAARPFSPPARLSVIGIMVLACVSLATIQVVAPTPSLIWNASASAPIGLYWVREDHVVERGNLVLAWLPDTARIRAAERSYLPSNTPAVKRVAALDGDTVCVRNSSIMINERTVARALPADHAGRPLTVWWGCRALEGDEIFLLNEGSAASFDGRYFGPSRRRDIIGRLAPLWTF